jgi:hypothetical protein
VTVVAYRDEGDWFFTPQDLDREWETAHITEAQRAADYSSQLKLDNDPGCPLEVRDVRVGMDKTYPSLRNVSFALVNKSAVTVQGYGLALGRVDDECFGVTTARPAVILPGATLKSEKPLGYSAYLYWCEGVMDHRLVVDHVTFADGTEWHDPRFLDEDHRRKCAQ